MVSDKLLKEVFKPQIKTVVLPNNLRVVSDEVSTVDSVVVAVMAKAGSQNEVAVNSGVAHFLEHMAFKGTKKRTSKDISDAIENVGGYMNAYTSKEVTMYYIKVLKEDIELAVEVLSDILQNSVIDAAELERERGVILQEFKASLDTPSDIVFDYFAESSFGGDTPIGRPIIGSEKTIKGMSQSDLRSFIAKNYFGKNMLVGACGNFEHEKFVGLVSKYFGSIQPTGSVEPVNSKYVGGGGVMKHKSDLKQMQFLLGFEALGDRDFAESCKLGIVSSILGGGMSSRLFQEIREKRGLAYSVNSYTDVYDQSGMLCVYADSSVGNLSELFDGVMSVLNGVVQGVSLDELSRTVNQYRASTLMSQESLQFRVRKMLNNFSVYGRYIYPDEMLSVVSSISQEEVQNVLSSVIFSPKKDPTMLIYGDFDKTPALIKDFASYIKC